MAALLGHLELLNSTASSINDLDFATSHPFTNALLNNQEITALIRDTEPHERGLFSVNDGQSTESTSDAARRMTQGPSNSSTVARLLGKDTLRKIRTSQRDGSKGRGVDIEVLLQSVEKLSSVYAVTGAMGRVQKLRTKHQQLSASIQHYDQLVGVQQSAMNDFDHVKPEPDDLDARDITDEDIQEQEQAVKALEAKKKALEARVAGIAKDLDGVLGQSG